jgi:hypothetical protein
MRSFVLAFCLAASCAPGDGPIDRGADGGTDGGTHHGDMRGCRTACDCPSGETCAGGDCITGIVPVYCCSDEACPSQQICESPNGEVSLCGGLGTSRSP